MFLAKESGVDSHRMKHRDWDWPTLLLLLLIVIWHRCWHHRPELGESDQTVILSNHVDLVLFPPFLRIILNITEANPIRGCCMLSTKYFWTFHFLIRCQFCLSLDRIGKAFNFQESHFISPNAAPTSCDLSTIHKKQMFEFARQVLKTGMLIVRISKVCVQLQFFLSTVWLFLTVAGWLYWLLPMPVVVDAPGREENRRLLPTWRLLPTHL